MTISVALATYNGEKFIKEQLSSILNQSIHIDEVVICDDCSTDATVKIILEFLNDHGLTQQWKLCVNERNLGYANNFRKAAYLCIGDVVFFCDQDDIWVEDRAEKMTQVMQDHQEISVLTSKMFWFTEDSKKQIEKQYKKSSLKIKRIKFNCRNSYLRAPGCTMCVRRSFLQKVEREWYSGWAQDEAVWCLSIIRGELFLMDFVSLYRRDHSGRTSGQLGHNKEKRDKYLSDLQMCCRCMINAAFDLSNEKALKTYFFSYLMAKKRRKFLAHKKIKNMIKLIPYLKYYYSKKSFFAELLMH